MNLLLLISALFLGLFLFSTFIIVINLRRVVPTNEVHIIQSSGKTTSYGKDTTEGNVYYEWPSWIPLMGIVKTVLPVSVFKIELQSYEAYDKGRLPFEVDIVGFFRINDSNMAAQRASSFEQVKEQLTFIVRGAVRTVLASHDIDEIMTQRSTFGEAFTKEVQDQLTQWGVIPVKNLELMDIRDSGQSQVIHNIMQKKKSEIEMQSRITVADNMQKAQVAEVEAQREVEVQKQTAAQTVGLRNAEREKQVGIATQQAAQEVKEQERITKEKEMAVTRVANTQAAEIARNVTVVNADAAKQTAILNADAAKQTQILSAEATKQTAILTSEGTLESKKREAEGTQLVGLAKAEAEKAMQLAPVQAQITLAKEIGANPEYQNYLVTIRKVEAAQQIGMEQAHALEKANIKIIANTGEPVAGLTNVMDLFTAKGGTSVGAMLEGLAQTDAGQGIINKLKGGNGKADLHA